MGGGERLSKDAAYGLVKEAQSQTVAMRSESGGETSTWRDVYAPIRHFNEAKVAEHKLEASTPKQEAKSEAERAPIARETKREVGAAAIDGSRVRERHAEAYRPRHMRTEQPVESMSALRPNESINDYINRMVKEEIASDTARRGQANYQPRHMRAVEVKPASELDRRLPHIEQSPEEEKLRLEQGKDIYEEATFAQAFNKTAAEHPISAAAAEKFDAYEFAKEKKEDVSVYRFTEPEEVADVDSYLIQQGAKGASMDELRADADDLLPISEQYRDIDHPDDAVHKGIAEFNENLKLEREPEVHSEAVRRANHMAAELSTPHGRIEGVISRHEARREQREADKEDGYTKLPGYRAVVRGRDKYDRLDAENTYQRGWNVRDEEYNRKYGSAIDELALQNYMAWPKDLSTEEKTARLDKFNARFNVRTNASDEDRENGTDMITPISLARLEHEAKVREAAQRNNWRIINRVGFRPTRHAEEERDRGNRDHMTKAQKVAAAAIAISVGVGSALGAISSAQARSNYNNPAIVTAAYGEEGRHDANTGETSGDAFADQGLNGETQTADAETETGSEAMEARHYTADNLPPLDHHMWNSPNKRSATAFTAEVDTSSREATYTHFMDACESMPEQLSIFANTLLSPEQAQQLGLTGDNNADADVLTTNNEMRANVLNAVSGTLFNENTSYEDVTLGGNYTDYGIRQNSDGSFTLIDGETNLTGEEAIQIVNGDNVMVVIKACDNVVQKVMGRVVRVVQRQTISHVEQAPEKATTTADTTTTTTTTNETPGTPTTDKDTPTPDTPSDTPDQPGTPDEPGTPDTPTPDNPTPDNPQPDNPSPDNPDQPGGGDVTVVPKADSQIGEENGNPHVTVNEEEGNVNNPTGVTEHYERGGGTTSAEQAAPAASETTSTQTTAPAAQPAQTSTTGTSSEPVTVSQNQTPQQRVEQIYQEEVTRANGNAEAAPTTTNAPVSGGESYQEAESHVGESTGTNNAGETVDQAQETVTTGFNAE